MTLADLSAPFDLVACVSLAVMAGVFGLLPVRFVMPCWARKRREVALVFAVAGLRRCATVARLDEVAAALWIVSAVITMLSAATAVRDVLREARRVRSS